MTLENDLNLSDLVTVIVTSHLDENTSIERFEYVIENFIEKTGLSDCQFIINFDKHDNNPKTLDYLHNLKNIKLVNGKLLVHEKSYFASAFIESVFKVETPFIFLLEHDWLFLEEIDLNLIIRIMNEHGINYIRFNKRKNKIWGVDEILENWEFGNFKLTKTSGWSNNPYIAKAEKIKEWTQYIKMENGYTLGEGEIHKAYVLDMMKDGFEKAHDKWRVFLYGAMGEGPFVYHLGYEKFGKNLEFLNCEKVCFCKQHCNCGGGIHSFQKAYEIVLNVIKPKKILEWGPGINTELALKRGILVHSVEQDEQYCVRFLGNENFLADIVPVEYEQYLAKDFISGCDLFFVDSRRRSECLEAISRHDHDYVVCLHDAQRHRYWKSLRLFKYVIFLQYDFCVATNNREYFAKLKSLI